MKNSLKKSIVSIFTVCLFFNLGPNFSGNGPLLMSHTTEMQAECGFWSWLWGNCSKAPKDYPCYAKVLQEVKLTINGQLEVKIEEVSVVTGNRIDCVTAPEESTCSQEKKC